MDWNLSKDQELVRKTVRKIAQKELAPRAAEVDRVGSFVHEQLKKLKEADVLGLAIPSEYEGISIDTLSFVLAVEEITKACGSTALSFVSHAICSYIIHSRPQNRTLEGADGAWPLSPSIALRTEP